MNGNQIKFQEISLEIIYLVLLTQRYKEEKTEYYPVSTMYWTS